MVSDMEFEDGTLLRLRAPRPGGVPSVSLLPGLGAHRLAVRVEVERLRVAEGVNRAVFSGEVRAMDGLGWIGSFHAVPMPFRTQAQVVPVDLMVPVTSEQVLALEKYRDGQDLAVLLEVEGTLPQSAAYPFAHIQQERSVPAGIWEHQIRTLGLAVSFSISVPWPAAGGPLAAAAGHLRTADQQITAGDYPDAIRETRLAVDAMRALKIWPKNGSRKRSGQDQAEGYAILLDRLADQAGGHAEPARALLGRASGPQPSDGVIGSGSWVRSDAIALNGMAASLLHRLAEEGC